MNSNITYVSLSQMTRKEREQYMDGIKAHLTGDKPKSESRLKSFFDVLGNALSMMPMVW
jgi:hypothetical protein